jgi:hypothetical protein
MAWQYVPRSSRMPAASARRFSNCSDEQTASICDPSVPPLGPMRSLSSSSATRIVRGQHWRRKCLQVP